MNEVLNKYFNPESIKLAFFRVQCWPDRMVKDQVGLRAFGANLNENCSSFSEKIITGHYVPSRGFKYYMPKSSGTTRTKTLLEIEDAIVYQAIANVIAHQSYSELSEHSAFVFGSVLSPETAKGLSILEEKEPNFFFFKFWKHLYLQFKESVIHSIEKNKVKYKFETDITGFFDCIPHYNLMSKLSVRFGVEDEILDLLATCFNAWSGTKESVTPGVGIPQGCVPSFFFANLLLHDLDDLLVEKGLKYYRYMDDIKIYGYEEIDLKRALVEIDMYLKGNGLSINSKKTSIQEIDENSEDETVKEMKKIEIFDQYEGDEIIENFESDLKKNSATMLSQDQDDTIFQTPNIISLTDRQEIESFYKDQINDVETELPAYFENPLVESLELKPGIDDIDLIKQSVKYSQSIRGLKEIEIDISPNPALIKLWLFAYEKFFWRANSLGLTLSLYGDNHEIKERLLQLITNQFDLFEWNRYFAFQTLSFNFKFSDRELREVFFKLLREEKSDLTKISIYRLLFKHSKNLQFNATLRKQLQKEKNQYLKVLITDFIRNNSSENIDIVEFINSIGL